MNQAKENRIRLNKALLRIIEASGSEHEGLKIFADGITAKRMDKKIEQAEKLAEEIEAENSGR